ncbi:MAG: RidA family protein [Arenicellales bacterium WSBS_2016_MAG_OTU3]
MAKEIIATNNAPSAIGTYSQAVKIDNTVYISGQIPLDPATMEVVVGIEAAIRRVFENVKAVAEASGGSIQDAVKLTIFMTDLGNFAQVNEIMAEYFDAPYPARAVVEVAALPKGVPVEIEAILHLGNAR